MKEKPRATEIDIECCDTPPATCPRRYCSLAFRSLEGASEIDTKKSKKQVKKKRGAYDGI